MAETMKKSDKVYFVLVPKVGAPVPNVEIIASQRVAKIENGVQVEPPKTDILRPNGQGLFMLDVNHPEYKTRKTALEKYMAVKNLKGKSPVMVGPFSEAKDAFTEMDRVRPKTDAENAAREKARAEKLEADNKAKDDELAELKAKLAEATAKKPAASSRAGK